MAEGPVSAEIPELAYVFTERGLESVALDGTRALVLAMAGATSCVHDDRRGVSWVLTREGTVLAVDHRAESKIVEVATRVPDSADALIVDLGDRELGRPAIFNLAARLVARPDPDIVAEVDCLHELGWECWEDVATGPLTEEYEQARAAIDAVEVRDASAVRNLVTRSPVMGLEAHTAEPRPRVDSVPAAGCQSIPEDCGLAVELPRTAYWIVLTADAHGDLYHQRVELYDPIARVFLDIDDPRLTRDAPTDEWLELERLDVSASGAGYAFEADGAVGVVSFLNGPVLHAERGLLCGWNRPGYRLPNALEPGNPFE